VIPLAVLLQDTPLRVRAIGRLGAEHREEARRLLEPFPNAVADHLIADPAGTNESVLDYSEPGERRESAEVNVAALTGADLAPVAGAEAVLVNMISGCDVGRATLAGVFRAGPRLRYLDVQALARTTRGPRRPRTVPDGAAWARLFPVVRGNREEIGCLGGSPGHPERAARRLLAAGAEEVLATGGADGIRRWTSGSAGVEAGSFDAVPCAEPRDPTGCGDSFLAAVVAGRIRGLDGPASVRLGAAVAARVAALEGLEALRALQEERVELLAAARGGVPG